MAHADMSGQSPVLRYARSDASVWTWAALLVALLALAGSLYLSIGMGLKACPLCFYQRTFVMATVAVLGIGLLSGRRHWYVLNLLSLPLVTGALGVAAFHVYLEVTGKLECPPGVMGVGTAPQQSLAVLIVLLALIALGIVRGKKIEESKPSVIGAAAALGLLLAWAGVVSAPPLPTAPTKAYATPLDICRPPSVNPLRK
jgi:disulfide bond formation protein DsbB